MTDRDRLIELYENSLPKSIEVWQRKYTVEAVDYLLANGVILKKQGEWISAPIKDKGYDSKTIPTCTNCGHQSFITYTFCPECGAKLKECEQV